MKTSFFARESSASVETPPAGRYRRASTMRNFTPLIGAPPLWNTRPR